MTGSTTENAPPRPRTLFRAIAGWRSADLGPDLAAGLTLAAIAIPEQMATARLGGFPPLLGFTVFIAGTLGFVLLGSSRVLSAGADSTITPIFAGTLVLLAASGSPAYFGLAAILALMTGALLIAGGIFRMGWIADLLSIPVMTGFLAGISIHIAVSQLPSLLGLTVTPSETIPRLVAVVEDLARANWIAFALGAGVFAATFAAEKIDSRIPGALIGVVGATVATAALGLESHGVAVIGAVSDGIPSLTMPSLDFAQFVRLLPLALTVAAVTMIQTAATTRAFPGAGAPDVNRDFLGVGAGSVLSGIFGGFPVDASPPRTGAVKETGGRSQVAGLVAAAAVAALLAFGGGLLAHVPTASLAGILFFVAQRIMRVGVAKTVLRQSVGEFILILTTLAAIVVLPIQMGVGLGILLSLLHGTWTMTRAQLIEFERIPGTTIWWPQSRERAGEKLDGVMVAAFQAPLAFMNADIFEHELRRAVGRRTGLRLIVLEASAIAEVDYTAAQSLTAVMRRCRERGVDFAVARLESTRAQAAFRRFGLLDTLGQDHLFLSVEDAVAKLGPKSQPRE